MYNSLYGLSFSEGDLSTSWISGLDVISSEVKRRVSTHLNSYRRYVVQPSNKPYNPLTQEPPTEIILINENYGSTVYDYLSTPTSQLSSSDITEAISESLSYDPRIELISVQNPNPIDIVVKFRVESSSLSISI